MANPEDQFEQEIVKPTMEMALRQEQLRSKLTALRSNIAHIERNMMKVGLTTEEMENAVELAGEAEAALFKVRYALGYP